MSSRFNIAGTLFVIALWATPAAAEIVVEETILKVEIRGWTYTLEAIIAKPADVTDKLPLALLTHGSPRSAADRPKASAAGTLGGQARDMAHRGWLAVGVIRRGFGKSDGPFAEGYDCSAPNFRRALATAVEDIAAAHLVVAKRPDVDPSRVIGMGVSVGGATMLAWAATKPKGLVGIFNVSGGTGSSAPGVNCDENGLVSTFASFGEDVRVPTLWFYAENDSFFGPSLVRRLHAAYTKGGGLAELHQLGPVGNDGHSIWGAYDGQRQWLPAVDKFLRASGLPSWNPDPIDKAAADLAPDAKRTLGGFLAAPTEKAISVSSQKGLARFWSGVTNIEIARQKSRELCEKDSGGPCTVLIENFTPARADGR